MAPIAFASSWLITSALTSRSVTSKELTRSSTSLIVACETAPTAEKSNLKRPGAFSEPACVAVSPNASRNALCTICVAVCAREIPSRRSLSISAKPFSLTNASPLTTFPLCRNKFGRGVCTSSISITAPLAVRINPLSESWPPPSA